MTAPDKKCEHNLSIHTRYMSWCSVCGSMRHGRSKTWQLPTRPVQAVESTCKHWIDGQITGECNHQLPPPSGLARLDEKAVKEILERNKLPGKDCRELAAKEICSRFGCRDVRVEEIEEGISHIPSTHYPISLINGEPYYYMSKKTIAQAIHKLFKKGGE